MEQIIGILFLLLVLVAPCALARVIVKFLGRKRT